MAEQILLMDNITVIYPNGFAANRDVRLAFERGSIHALLGENGAGKTTLMKVLFGFLEPTEGQIVLKGQPIRFKDSLDAIRHGVGMVHQHFMLVDELTVAENLVLGMEPLRRGLFDMEEAVRITQDIAKKYNFEVDPRATVAECSVGVKQKIEIMKALLRGAEILILDEPTAVLTPQEVTELFVELKKLRDMGHTIVFISHKLNEVKELCDSFTILRRGRTVAVGNVNDYTEQELSNMIRRARKVSREDYVDLAERLREGDFLPGLVAPYLEKVNDRIRELDADAIAAICPAPMQMNFEEGIEAYQKIKEGDFLPELKTDALKTLEKRLSKIKADECELLVGKLKKELEENGVGENPRHHFYPARKVLLGQATPEETDVIEYAMASYAAGRGLFEYPILVVDVARDASGKEGMILTPEHLYYSTAFTSYGIPVASIASVTASTGLLNKGLYVHQKNGTKLKIPYAVGTKELPDYAGELDDFIHYLQEKPESRKLTYLASEKHDTICCFRCGYQYKGGGVCPKCGYQNNG